MDGVLFAIFGFGGVFRFEDRLRARRWTALRSKPESYQRERVDLAVGSDLVLLLEALQR